VKNAPNPKTFCDLNEQRRVFDINNLAGWHLRNIERQPKDVRVGLAELDKA
jgi:hypothetical protein